MTQRPTTRDGWIAFALRNVDESDIQWLLGRLDDSGHGKFWRAVLRELHTAVDGETLMGSKED